MNQMSPAAALAGLPVTPRLPALFIGHGSPMNAITDTPYSRAWRLLGESLPRPRAILCVSAHWATQGSTLVDIAARPPTIHDFGGFPQRLFEQIYPASGAPDYARAAMGLVRSTRLEGDRNWGFDHGSWGVLLQMFPHADVPLFQMSLDLAKSPQAHFRLAQELRPLRERGLLIVASGNLVHNLYAMTQSGQAHPWAVEFDARAAEHIRARDIARLVQLGTQGPLAQMANPTLEHFLPVLYALGAADPKDELTFFNEGIDLAAISMRSFVLA
ncbi:4,5-DOPA dioxygenase extradiol [Acidocella sp.]|uniref:4,5-DOPA-extradiol-dioxygenase n=1 Tax=Acidocella sp. TaxID=50710 RepID=UPI00261E29F8|nr:4,5-DOPA dioxygenase extradiol [Acidocella sp.]